MMHIVISFDSNFVLPAVVMIYSLMKNNDNVVLHVLYADLKKTERDLVAKMTFPDKNQKIEFHKIDESITDKLRGNGRFSKATFYRFVSYQLLDESIDKALYLDTDILVKGELNTLYDTEFKENEFFIACQEYTIAAQQHTEFEHYVNAGVLHMNLSKLRATDDMDRYWKLVMAPDYEDELPDQNALNIIFQNKIGLVPQEKWNCVPFWSGISEEIKRQLMFGSHIVHYATELKPWKIESVDALKNFVRTNTEVAYFYALYNVYMQEAITHLETH